ncbi:hypothetical protein [Allokutzneria multivorans]|uniref:hypothetical protein n=1 Tax=Allokutzneria multivorans TaxID=1142134 RepID=UPI0031EDAD6E
MRADLRSLPKGAAESIAKHIVAAGQLIDDEPEKALEHARYARSKAGRVALVREAAGLAAYHAGEWAEAIAELRASRRMGGGPGHLAILADCERALGRPERALEFARSSDAAQLSADQAVELRIVIAGARRDMGQLDAAVVALQGDDLDEKRRDPWSARLFYAYADNLAAAGRTEEAVRWFINAAEADVEEETDASERASELSGGAPAQFLVQVPKPPALAKEDSPAESDGTRSEATETDSAGAAESGAVAAEAKDGVATDGADKDSADKDSGGNDRADAAGNDGAGDSAAEEAAEDVTAESSASADSAPEGSVSGENVAGDRAAESDAVTKKDSEKDDKDDSAS